MTAANQFVRGATWMVALRWVVRILGLVRTVVLARLLAPDDFGVFAIALVVLGFIEFLSEGGIEFALIREQQAERAHFDSAWTMQIILGLLTAILIFASAPIMAQVFKEPRAELVIQIIALRPAINAFNNIGVVYFLKEFDFGKEFKFSIARDVIETVTTIGLALVLGNYFALVLGTVMGAVLFTGFSYMIHPYRPRISFQKTRDIFSFSGWLVVSNAAEEIGDLIDRTVIGAIAAANVLGIYQMAQMLSNVIMHSTISPLWRGLFPSYSKIAHDPEKLAASFKAVFGWVAVICSAGGFGVAAVADDFVIAVIGQKWEGAVPLVPWITLALAITGIGDAPVLVLMALGRAKLCAVQSLIRLVALLIALPTAGLLWGSQGVAAAFFFAVLMHLPVPFYMMTTNSIIRWADVVAHAWRPIVSGLIMHVAVLALSDAIDVHPLISLGYRSLVGAIIFIGSSLILWSLTGRPNGPEALVVRFLGGRLRPRRAT